MLESMTGFGRCEQSNAHGSVLVEARSVNGRYLKVTLRAPDLLLGHESEIERRVRERVARGTVNLAIHLRMTGDAAVYRINAEVVATYAKTLEALRAEIASSAPIQLEALAALPGAVEAVESSDLAEAVWPLVLEALDRAIDDLIAMRRVEGEALTAALAGHVDEIERRVDAIADLAPQVLKGYRDRLLGRVRDLAAGAGVSISEADLVRELSIYAERCDIAEEINRLRSHVAQFRTVAAAPEPAEGEKTPGRTLEFIIQEMQREANTIGSKANDEAVSPNVVALKAEIDRMKEQIQNVA